MFLTNSTQTQLSEQEWKALDRELRLELSDYMNTIKFLKLLTDKDRPYAKDRPRREDGRIIVDITCPHILQDMDYFRQAAIHFQQHGIYTNHYPNSHPQSAFVQFWKEEARRCRAGMVRESDGEWISGDYYFYLNYGRIYLTKTTKGSKKAERVEGFPNVYDGDYFYYHYLEDCKEAGKHASVLKSRGRGFSFKGGADLAKHFILGASLEAIKGVKAYAIADEKEYLIKDGILNKFIDTVDHCSKHTPWPKIRDLKDSWNDMHWKMGYKDPESNAELGIKNEVMGVTLKNDPDKARGKRGARILWEEMGRFPCILQAWGIARPSVEDGDFAFGLMVAFGTGGTDNANFSGAEELFYYPKGYNIHALPNIFDKNQEGGNSCGFFFAEYLNRTGCYDENGNSDIVKSLIELLKTRITIRREASDPNTIVRDKAEKPITPQEAIMRKEGSVFPTTDLKEHLSDIMPNLPKFTAPHYIGHLIMDGRGDIDWKMDPMIAPIRDFPLKDNKAEGAIEIFEMPYKNSQGDIPANLYIAGIDTLDDDQSTTTSLFSIFIMNTLTERIVAEYTGRTFTVEDSYEKARRLLIFYNAIAAYENDKKGLYAYFRNKNSLHLLADTPEIIRDLDMGTIYTSGNKSKGINSSVKINAWGRRLQASWMMQQAYSQSEAEDEAPLLNLHKIRSIGYIKEAIAWHSDINADRVSAMGMLMILKADRERFEVKLEGNSKGLESDPFWDKSFGRLPQQGLMGESFIKAFN